MVRRTLLRYGVDKLFDSVYEVIADKIDETSEYVEEKVDELQARVLSKIFAIGLFLIGGIFLLLAGYQLLNEIAGLSKTVSYAIMGGFVLILGFIANR